jgi:hypothetical protein
MYIYEKPELVEHPEFQQAIILSEMQTNAQWRSIYRDKSGELAISFYGKLTEDQIKIVLMHFKDLIDGDTNVDNISCKYGVDYSYDNGHHANGEKEYTQVFTPDGYNYSQF